MSRLMTLRRNSITRTSVGVTLGSEMGNGKRYVMTTEQPTTDQIATPQTDAASFEVKHQAIYKRVVPADFSRAQERRIAELVAALKPFAKPEAFDQAAQIRALISQISGNPVNGADAFIWWMQKHFSVQHFKDAVAVIAKATQP